MNKRVEQFISLSAALTGCSRVELLGTGMTSEYLSALDAALPGGVLDEMLSSFERTPQGSESGVQEEILSDPKLGPVARNLILLWYCGSWSALPADWHTTYGISPTEKIGVVSAQAYQAGLQWAVIGAHAPGSSQQGFASWSILPQEVTV